MNTSVSDSWKDLVKYFIYPTGVLVVAWLISRAATGLSLAPHHLDIASLMSGTLYWLAGASYFNRMARILIWDKVVASVVGRTPPQLLVQLGNFIVYLITMSFIISRVFNESVTSFWAASGALGVVIGLALRNLIMDTFSGLALQLEAPFRAGDWISVHTRMGEFLGRVEDTNWRTTRLWRTDRSTIVIPNSYITNTVMVNLTNPDPIGRFEIEFTLDYKVPYERAIRILTAAMIDSIGDKGPLADPKPKVRLNGIGTYGLTYLGRYYLRPEQVTPSKARNTIYANVVEHLKRAGLTMAYPKQDIFLASMPWRQQNWEYNKDRARLLSQVGLFTDLNASEHEYLAKHCELIELKPGDSVIHQGEEGSSMFILGEGLLDVYIKLPDSENPVNIARLTPGSFFGEKSLLTGEPRSATITAVTVAIVCRISSNSMHELFKEKPDVAETLARTVAKREIENNAKFSELSAQEKEDAMRSTAGSFLQKIKNFLPFSRA